jgi:hypothetical protein
MLPNFKVVIGAIMFAVLLFAVTGAGVVMPETYTRIGEAPEIGRPMMQRMIADEPAQAQFQVLTLTRRSEELDRVGERTSLEVEAIPVAASQESAEGQVPPATQQSDAKPALLEAPERDVVTPTVEAAPPLQPSGAMGTAVAPPTDAVDAQPVAAKPDIATPDIAKPDIAKPEMAKPDAAAEMAPPLAPAAMQVAELPPAPDAKSPTPASPQQAKSPKLRRIGKAAAPRKRTFHRTRFVRTQANTQTIGLGQNSFGLQSSQFR